MGRIMGYVMSTGIAGGATPLEFRFFLESLFLLFEHLFILVCDPGCLF